MMIEFHAASEVAPMLEAFVEALKRRQNVDWSLLPGLPVLLKMNEDLELVGVDPRAG